MPDAALRSQNRAQQPGWQRVGMDALRMAVPPRGSTGLNPERGGGAARLVQSDSR